MRRRLATLALALVLAVTWAGPAYGHGCAIPHQNHAALHSGHWDYWDYNGHNGAVPNHYVYWYNGTHFYSQNDNCNEPQ